MSQNNSKCRATNLRFVTDLIDININDIMMFENAIGKYLYSIFVLNMKTIFLNAAHGITPLLMASAVAKIVTLQPYSLVNESCESTTLPDL